MWYFVLLPLLLQLIQRAVSENYCDPALCPAGLEHIGCNVPVATDNCPPNAQVIATNKEFVKLVLDMHNKRRNAIAGGIGQFAPAKAMPIMIWDEELSQLALLNAQQCRLRYDSCHNTPHFPRSGQSIFFGGTPSGRGGVDVAFFVDTALSTWYSERQFSNSTVLLRNDNEKLAYLTHNFNNLVLEGNNFVGCAAVTFTVDAIDKFLLVCNYSTKVRAGEPIYEAAEWVGGGGTGCLKGRNQDFLNLCWMN